MARWLRGVPGALATAALLAFAAWYMVGTAAAIAHLGWRSPMFDQWRGYTYYLLHDFPANVLQLENGHRPVVPALLRVFEAWCCDAGQQLQIAAGATLAVAAVLLVAAVALRDRLLSWPLRATAVLAGAVGILWLGNARMLMHGNESVHAYLVVVCVMGAALLAGRDGANPSRRAVLSAAMLCAVAMFSFGPGVASFASTAMVLMVNRAPPRRLLPLACVFVVALALYLFALPGDEGVRNQLLLRPWQSAVIVVQWLGAPFVNGWLFSAPGVGPDWMSAGMAREGGVLVEPLRSSAAWMVEGAADIPGRVLAVAGIIGTAGVLAWLWLAWRLWRRWAPIHRLQSLSLGTTAFSLATAALIGIARLQLFAEHPGQVLADRYLVWSTLFWSGLAALLLYEIQTIGRTVPRRVGSALACVLVAGLAVLMLPSHRQGAGWAGAVNRHSELAIAAAWLDVRGHLFPDGDDASRSDVERSLAAMRAGAIGPFARPPPALPGASAPADAVDCGTPIASAHWNEAGRQVTELSGYCDRLGHARQWLLVVDEAGIVRGLARTLPDGDALLPGRAARRGYAGLVVQPATGSTYRTLVPAPSAGSAD